MPRVLSNGQPEKPGYGTRLLIAISQLLNVLLNGSPDEMLSARAWRNHTSSRFWCVVKESIDFVFGWQVEHCRQCYEWEVARKDTPQEYLNG